MFVYLSMLLYSNPPLTISHAYSALRLAPLAYVELYKEKKTIKDMRRLIILIVSQSETVPSILRLKLQVYFLLYLCNKLNN